MSKKILVVDDSISVRKLIAMSLSEAGYEVLEAGDGEEGVQVLAEQGADLIITDLNMPKASGIDLIKTVRAIPERKFLPIIMLTTEAEQDKKLQAREAGATAWIIKPFQQEKLISLILMIFNR